MKRIFILDDNPDILDVITLILDNEGYEITAILNGNELLDIIMTFNPDLILKYKEHPAFIYHNIITPGTTLEYWPLLN